MKFKYQTVETPASKIGVFPPAEVVIAASELEGVPDIGFSIVGPSLDGELAPWWDVLDCQSGQNETFDSRKEALDFAKGKMKEYVMNQPFLNNHE